MASKEESLVVRADANTAIGYGHVMRCLALAQAWQDRMGPVTFVTAAPEPAVHDRLRAEGMATLDLGVVTGSTEDASRTIEEARRRSARWVVIDGYEFDARYRRSLVDSGFHLLFIDDKGCTDRCYADLVLNQNLHANESMYGSTASNTRLLLGTHYALLRKEFLEWKGSARQTPTVARKVLVTLGGGDPANMTLKVIDALQRVDDGENEAVVVVGGGNPHMPELETAAQKSSVPIRLERDVVNMPELMAWADIAVSAAGSTCWELAFMSLPTLLLVLFDNQQPIATALGEAGVAINLGWHEHVSVSDITLALMKLRDDVHLRGEMARLGRDLVDGGGPARVVAAMQAAQE